MIERKFVAQNVKEFRIKEFLFQELTRAGLSEVKLQRTPLGEKIVVTASRPGLVVGKGGTNIARLTEELRKNFQLENPQIEIEEITDPRGNAAITAEMIANSLERFGSARFKGVGHKALSTVMSSGALGVEILISGRIPSSRARTWRFYQGYLKKCGDISVSGVEKAQQIAKLKTGVVGIQVSIMPSTTVLPDKIDLVEEPHTLVEEVKEETDIQKAQQEAEVAQKEAEQSEAQKEIVEKIKEKETKAKKPIEDKKKPKKEVKKKETLAEKKPKAKAVKKEPEAKKEVPAKTEKKATKKTTKKASKKEETKEDEK